MAHPLFAGEKLSWDSMLKAALWYAGRGWPVFPCNTDKSPLSEHSFKDATKDATQIKVWWTRWPMASIGVPTGTITNIVVIDIDVRNGGDKSWAALIEKHGELTTLTQTTGGGGKHHLHDAGGKQFAGGNGKLGAGIDVKADGGYIIVAPSGHPSGNRYEWDNYPEQPPAPLPSWLEKLIIKPEKKTQSKNGTAHGAKIPQGQRRDDAKNLAGGMRRKGCSADAIFAALKAENDAGRYDPAFSEQELRDLCRLAQDFEARYEPAPPEETPGRILITELSNAERLLVKYAGDLRYAADRQVWCVWTGRLWAVNDVAGALRMMGDVCRGIYSEAGAQPSEDLRAAFAVWAKKSESHHVQENSLQMARIDLAVEVRRFANVFDRHSHILNLPNGMVNTDTGAFLPHDRSWFITKMAPIEYHDQAKCPRFLKFLEQTFPDEEMRDYIQRFAGLCLTGKTSNQSWWMFYGPTASGKSTLLSILRGILGPYALPLPENYFLLTKNTTDFATAHLQGVRLATCVETNEGKTLDVAKLKTLTGEDALLAQLKHQNYFEFTPEAKLVLATNHRPKIPATDDSIWRRVKVVGFDHTVPFEDRVEDLAKTLVAQEGPGILRWAIDGCQKGKLVEPDAVKNAVAEYRSAEDVVRNFLNAETEADFDARTSRAELSKRFSEWCRNEGIRQMSGKRLVAELARLGILKSSIDPERYFDGIRIVGSLPGRP